MNPHDELLDLCKQFIKDNDIHCPQKVYESDRVIIHAHAFIEQICDVVGYCEDAPHPTLKDLL